MSLFLRLKERKLVQWAIAYVAGAWLLLELLGFIAENFGWPQGVVRSATVLLGVGLLVTLVLAWFHGEKGQQRASGLELLIFAGLLLVAGAALAYVNRDAGTETAIGPSHVPVDPRSIAVLPFQNRSAEGGEEAAFFADGIHDELLTQLAKIRSLTVTSRTSVMEYRDAARNLREIGGALRVATVLEGAVQRAGDQVRINVQLIDTETDSHLWADTYEEELTVENLFAIQSAVARRIASALRAELSPAEEQRLDAVPTDDPVAYDFYLRGNVYATRRGLAYQADADSAIDMYERAVARDSGFALAYARLSEVHSAYYQYGHDRSDSRRLLARTAVESALDIDATLPEAHRALGMHYYLVNRDHERALEELEEAERGLPGDVEVLKALGFVAKRQGRWDDAVAIAERVARLAPRDYRPFREMSLAHLFQRRYEEAERFAALALELHAEDVILLTSLSEIAVNGRGDTGPLRAVLAEIDPADDPDGEAAFKRWWVEFLDGRYAEALDVLRHTGPVRSGGYCDLPKSTVEGLTHRFAGELDLARATFEAARVELEGQLAERPEDERLRCGLGVAYAGLGRGEDAVREGLQAIELMPVSRDALAGSDFILELAWIYAMVGEPEAALGQLDRYLSGSGRWSLEGLRHDPRIEVLRDHPGFLLLVEKYGAPPG